MISAIDPPNAKQAAGEALLASITSPASTRYRLKRPGEGALIHVYCALDTLEYALVAPGHYEVTGDPPVGSAVRFTISPVGPEPALLWMSVVAPERVRVLPRAVGTPSPCCPFLHFFDSVHAYASWHDALPADIRACISSVRLAEAWTLAGCSLGACAVDCRGERQCTR